MPKQNPTASSGGGTGRGGSVRVVPGRTATGPGLETRGNKITVQSQKAAGNKVIDDSQYRTLNKFSGESVVKPNGRGPSAKTIAKAQPVVRAADKKIPIQINSANHQPRVGGNVPKD